MKSALIALMLAFALVILAFPLMLTNAYVGVDGVDPDAIEAARGMGMRPHQIVLANVLELFHTRARVSLSNNGWALRHELKSRVTTVDIELPPLEKPADSVAAAATIVAGVAAGDLTPSQAGQLAKVIDVYVRAIETKAFDERLSTVEQAVKSPPALGSEGAMHDDTCF